MGNKKSKACSVGEEAIEEMEIGEEHAERARCKPVETSSLMDCAESQQEVSSQLSTQSLNDSTDIPVSQTVTDGVWGQLYPHCGTFPRLTLTQDIFRLGRGTTMDYVIKESDMGSNEWWISVSKCQCEIVRDKTGIFLKDTSSNGTWVNANKVGRNNLWPLEHNSEICFASCKKKVFVFMSIEENSGKFPLELTSKYTVSKVLGRGACGEVRLGFRIPDIRRVAIKIISKRIPSPTLTGFTNSSSVLNEVKILQSVNHPCLINLEDVIDTTNFLYIVLEFAEGGELFDKIIDKTKFNEDEAKLHFYQMVSAIQYLHSKNICHRDLKPENVLLCSVDDCKPIVKITDMGLSKLINLDTVLKTFCGTPQYMAPEVVSAGGIPGCSYDLKVDCWSLGVILYILLSGTPPFSEERKCGLSLRSQILQANYNFYPSLFNNISSSAKDLIRHLLKICPNDRLSAEKILVHPWLQDPNIVREATALMNTKLKSKKRQMDEDWNDIGTRKKRLV